jgi:HSP20 family molecular chaperone IbpA
MLFERDYASTFNGLYHTEYSNDKNKLVYEILLVGASKEDFKINFDSADNMIKVEYTKSSDSIFAPKSNVFKIKLNNNYDGNTCQPSYKGGILKLSFDIKEKKKHKIKTFKIV